MGFSTPILIDQGEDGKFLADQLLPRSFEEACKAVGAPLVLRMQPGYDHSYYFIATFIDDNIAYQAHFLKSAPDRQVTCSEAIEAAVLFQRACFRSVLLSLSMLTSFQSFVFSPEANNMST